MPFEKITNSLLLVDLLMLRTWISSIIRTQFPITHVSERDRCLWGILDVVDLICLMIFYYYSKYSKGTGTLWGNPDSVSVLIILRLICPITPVIAEYRFMFAIRKCQKHSRYSNFYRGALGKTADVFRSFQVLEWFQLVEINTIRRRRVAVFVVSCLLKLEPVKQSPCDSHYSNHFLLFPQGTRKSCDLF